MKYYFILPDLAAGGAERVSITIARILTRNGFNVEFLNLGKHEGDMVTWIEPEFKLTSFGCNRTLTALPKLVAFMRKHPSDRFYSSRVHTNLAGILAATLSGRKIIVRVPNMPKNNLTGGSLGIMKRLSITASKFLLPKAIFVIAQNEEMRNQLLTFYSLPPEKVVVINNPIDKDYVIKMSRDGGNPFNKKEKVFLAACTVDYRKGIDILIDAWPKVKSCIPQAHLYVIGRDNSEYAMEMKEKAKRMESFTFLGFQSNPYPFLKNCDVFVLSSRMEGFPNVVLEAMCLNRPVATTTCVDVIKKIIKPGVNGYYCNIEDANALADVMTKACSMGVLNNTYDMFSIDDLLSIFR